MNAMIKIPVQFLAAGLDLLAKTMGDFQAAYDETADDLTAPFDEDSAPLPTWLGTPATNSDASLGRPDACSHAQPNHKETSPMPEQDLGGDDVKNVSYWITFVKPDFVVTLQEMKTETIDYATTEASFGGLKLARFFQALGKKEVKWPEEWKVAPSNDYKKSADGKLTEIPRTDEKYIRIDIKLNWRRPLPDADREKDKIDVLRQIRDKLS